MKEGVIVVKDPSSMRIEIEGTQGTVVAKIPADFFEGSDSLTEGKVLAIVDIKSSAGGKSEVCYSNVLAFCIANGMPH